MARKTIQARVLADVAQLGLACGDLLQGTEEHVSALAAGGIVDPNADAVAYAKAMKARLVELEDPRAAWELGTAMAEAPKAPEAA